MNNEIKSVSMTCFQISEKAKEVIDHITIIAFLDNLTDIQKQQLDYCKSKIVQVEKELASLVYLNK
jgi:hypothetical protein